MVIIVMGVVGSGKTTIGQLLAQQLGWRFADADNFHSAASKEKIRHGIGLTDEDRAPWLASLSAAISSWIADGASAVLACSALKRSYRQQLQIGPEVRFVYLKGSAALIDQRLRARRGHFANQQILASQFADLEEPTGAIVTDISGAPEEIVADIRRKLGMS